MNCGALLGTIMQAKQLVIVPTYTARRCLTYHIIIYSYLHASSFRSLLFLFTCSFVPFGVVVWIVVTVAVAAVADAAATAARIGVVVAGVVRLLWW